MAKVITLSGLPRRLGAVGDELPPPEVSGEVMPPVGGDCASTPNCMRNKIIKISLIGGGVLLVAFVVGKALNKSNRRRGHR